MKSVANSKLVIVINHVGKFGKKKENKIKRLTSKENCKIFYQNQGWVNEKNVEKRYLQYKKDDCYHK